MDTALAGPPEAAEVTGPAEAVATPPSAEAQQTSPLLISDVFKLVAEQLSVNERTLLMGALCKEARDLVAGLSAAEGHPLRSEHHFRQPTWQSKTRARAPQTHRSQRMGPPTRSNCHPSRRGQPPLPSPRWRSAPR
jgi:hypothetical protein